MAGILKEGVFIAQGPENNILIRVVGKAPLLEIVGAIDLNAFYNTGSAKNLAKDSYEVMDILSCPEKYNFQTPSFTDAVMSEGLDYNKGKKIDIDNLPDDDFQSYVKEYKALHALYNSDQAEIKFIMWLKQTHDISFNNGKYLVKKIKAFFQRPLNEKQNGID